ncbi:hypothetical protein GPX89_34480 [Nocardia sp. ET3-3]|uniref:Uncharacterized protein n=1 Tax=Nocardia terrae TaxID=2675851 RepID=A0A7K1V794_9NOCA|nr:hypothetical protein [Nocardia terrae]MVU82329.1 hypothetical protein [Nocardia terrae]
MNETVIGWLDLTCTDAATGAQISTGKRECRIPVAPEAECKHDLTICEQCSPSWQCDYAFADPFPFERTEGRSLADLVAAGAIPADSTQNGTGTSTD